MSVRQLTLDELNAGLPHIESSPKDHGALRLALGSAVIEVTAEPHTGCGKFSSRFGEDATKFVNSNDGRRLHLRGINAKVVQSGTIRVGDLASQR